MEDRAGDSGKGERGDGQDGRGDGKWAEVRDREGGRGWLEPHQPPRLWNSPSTIPTCSSLALTSFSLPGANGFPCCSKDSVDITETP